MEDKSVKASNRAVVASRVGRRRRRVWPRGAVLAATTVAVVVGLAACGAGSSGPGVASGGSTTTQASSNSSASSSSNSSGSAAQIMLAFSRCVRSHGVPNFPDPNSDGSLPPGAKQIILNSPQWAAAQSACNHLLPNGGNGPTPAQWQQIRSGMVRFAQCMRRHGMPNWPDPTADPDHPGGYIFNIHVDPNSPQISTRMHECQHLLPSGVQGNGFPGWPALVQLLPRSARS